MSCSAFHSSTWPTVGAKVKHRDEGACRRSSTIDGREGSNPDLQTSIARAEGELAACASGLPPQASLKL